MKHDTRNWMTQTLQLSDLELDMNEIYLNLGYAGTQPDAHFVEMVQAMVQDISAFCKPQVGFCINQAYMPDKNFLVINHKPIKVGPVITKYLQGCTHIAIFVVSAGVEFDDYCTRLKADGDIVSDYIAYSIGTEIAEAALRFVSRKIAAEATILNMGYTHAYSPGHCSWHVREQEKLFRILPEKPCGIVLNQSNLMSPEKSVSGIIGLGPNVKLTAHSCEICGMQNCFKRTIQKSHN